MGETGRPPGELEQPGSDRELRSEHDQTAGGGPAAVATEGSPHGTTRSTELTRPGSRELARATGAGATRHEIADRQVFGWFSQQPEGAGRDGYGRQITRDEPPEHEVTRDWSKLNGQLEQHRITLVAVGLIIATVIWKAVFLSHFNYRQDDFQVMDVALKSHLTWSYLFHVDVGHFFPGVYAIAWVLSRVALYNWAAGAGVIVVMTAAASLAAWWMLRTLMGNRPAILIPLTLYLVTSLNFAVADWWITAVESIPMQAAIFMAVGTHIHYVRTKRMRHAIYAAAWLVLGLAFYEKAAVIPVLLFVITAGFLVRGRRLRSAIWNAIVEYRRGWALYLGILAAYAVTFFVALHTSTIQPAAPTSLRSVWTFSETLVFRTFLPGIVGGPWQWWHPGGQSAGAYSAPATDLAWLSLAVVLVIAAASILTRRKAWRAWIIVPGWLLVADILPVAIGRLTKPGWAVLLALVPRYVADAIAVLVIVIALAFWPVAVRKEDGTWNTPVRQRNFFGRRWLAVALGLVVVVTLGSFWSVAQLSRGTPVATGQYIANARAALAQVPSGTVIVDTKVPSEVMVPTFLHGAQTSVVLGPLSNRGSEVSWTGQPAGNISPLMVFGPDGRLYPAAISGVTSAHVPPWSRCLRSNKPQLVVGLPAAPAGGAYVRQLRIDYLANGSFVGTTLSVTYNGIVQHVPIMGGPHNAYLQVSGSSPSITLQAQAASGAFCFEKAVAGFIVALPGPGIPRSSA